MKIDKFLKDAGIIFFATILSSIFNMLYQLFMVRSLDPVDFGVLNTLLSLLIVISVPAGTLQTIATKFISTYKAQDKSEKITAFFEFFIKKVFIFSFALLFVVLVFSREIGIFLKITNHLLIIMCGILMLLSTILPFNLGALQGLQKFKSLGGVSLINAALRFFLGALLVTLSFKVDGAMAGVLLANFIALIFSFIPLVLYIKRQRSKNVSSAKEKLDLIPVYKYVFPVLIALPSFGLLTNMDVILVKRFFTPQEAGYYSVAQMVGKIILFLPAAVTVVMFPKVSEVHTKNGNTVHILKKCLIVVGVICLLASVFCGLFPEWVLKVLSGKVYPQCLPLIMPFAISMSFFALASVFMFYHLSVHDMRLIYTFLFCMLAQGIFIILFHGSLMQVLYILSACSIVLFLVNSLGVKGLVRA